MENCRYCGAGRVVWLYITPINVGPTRGLDTDGSYISGNFIPSQYTHFFIQRVEIIVTNDATLDLRLFTGHPMNFVNSSLLFHRRLVITYGGRLREPYS